MAEPVDMTQYVDLKLYDRDPQDLFDLAIQNMQIYMPDWTYREGHTEIILTEALALIVAELIYVVNRLPGGVMQAQLGLLGVDRDAGAQPLTDIEFHMSSSQGYTIPAGTQVRLNLSDGLEPVVFATMDDLIVDPGQTIGTMNAIGDRYTDDANGTPDGTAVDVIDSVSYVDYAVLGSDVTEGREAEEDEDYLQRASTRLSRFTDTLVVPAHFTAFALEQPYVHRATALDAYNPATDTDHNGPVGSDPGYIAVAVYGNGAPLSNADKTDLIDQINDAKLGMLVANLVDPTINTVNITVQVVAEDGYDVATVVDNVTDKLAELIGIDVWPWYTVLRRNLIIANVAQAEGVAYVNTLTLPSTDTNLNGVAPLTVLGTVNVDVVLP